MKRIAIAVGGIAVGVIAAIMLVSAAEMADGRIVTEQDFGAAWPFTVPEGRLRCTKASVTFEADGSTYAINGIAQSRGFPRVDPIWKYNPDPELEQMYEDYAKEKGITLAAAWKALGRLRVSIAPIIDAGLALCDE